MRFKLIQASRGDDGVVADSEQLRKVLGCAGEAARVCYFTGLVAEA